MCVRNLCEFVKTGFLIYVILFTSSSALCIAIYGAIKKLCSTNLCDLCSTRIIRINISHAEICRFTVILYSGKLLWDSILPFNLWV